MPIEQPHRVTRNQAQAIATAVRQVELSSTAAWSDLDILSSNTLVEGIEVFEDEIRSIGEAFEGPINVHVTLRYPDNDVTLSETFPGRFEAVSTGGKIIVTQVYVDTSSFTG